MYISHHVIVCTDSKIFSTGNIVKKRYPIRLKIVLYSHINSVNISIIQLSILFN